MQTIAQKKCVFLKKICSCGVKFVNLYATNEAHKRQNRWKHLETALTLTF